MPDPPSHVSSLYPRCCACGYFASRAYLALRVYAAGWLPGNDLASLSWKADIKRVKHLSNKKRKTSERIHINHSIFLSLFLLLSCDSHKITQSINEPVESSESSTLSNSVNICTDQQLKLAAHNISSLSDLNRYDVPERKIIFGYLKQETKQLVLREHADNILRKFRGSQRSFIHRLINHIDDLSIFKEEVVDRLETEARRIFSDLELYKYFNNIGSYRYPDQTSDDLTILDSDVSCNCSTQSDYCHAGISDPYDTCIANFDNCEPKNYCGFLWQYECNGRCWFLEGPMYPTKLVEALVGA